MASWRFSQVETPPGGKRDPIVLDGYSAPFGRPRKSPLVTNKLEVRNQVVRYPGNNGRPTRHILGMHRDDFELNGRWMDRMLGQDQVRRLVNQFEQYVADQVQVRIAWGNILSWTGVIENLETQWESDTEVVWKLRFLVDEQDGDDVLTTTQRFPFGQVTLDTFPAKAISERSSFSQLDGIKDDLNPTFLEKLDLLISLAAVPSAYLNDKLNTISSFEQLAIGDARRLITSANQLVQVALEAEDLIANSVNDAGNVAAEAIGVANNAATAVDIGAKIGDGSNGVIEGALLYQKTPDKDIRASKARAQTSVDNEDLLAVIADLKRSIRLAQLGKTSAGYVAKDGDTWESISNSVFGAVGRANDIRKVNGIKFGIMPQSGKVYKLPL